MKKLVLLLLTVLALASCNKGAVNGKYTKAHIEATGGVPIHCNVLDLTTLTNAANPTFEIKTAEYGWLVVNSNNFILYSTEKCPICNR